MKKIERWKPWTFVVVLLAVAYSANSVSDHLFRRDTWQEVVAPSFSEQSTPVAPYKPGESPEELAAKRAQFLAQYLNNRPTRTSGTASLAIMALNENGKANGAVVRALTARFQGDGVTVFSSIFTPRFVSDGLFAETFNDSHKAIERLELRECLDALLLARQHISYVTNTALENLITANMQLEIILMPITGGHGSRSWSFTAHGPGFNLMDARQAAEERIIKQIATATTLQFTEL